MSKINFVDLFCGAGGLATGLRSAGLNCLLSCDYNKDAVQSINLNHPDSINLLERIENLNKARLKKLLGSKKVHLVAGGPPCQGFSTIGLGDPDDDRNSMFRHFMKVIKNLDPEFVLFENVTGLVSKKNEKTLTAIIKSFHKLGYETHIDVLEAQHYGVAQKRRRLIIIGHKKGYSFSFPKKTHDVFNKGKYNQSLLLKDVLQKLKKSQLKKDAMHDLENAKITNRLDLKRIQAIPEGGRIRYQKDELKYLPKKLRLNINWDKIRENRLRENHYHRLSRKEVSPTINTHNHHYFHPKEDRKLTLREFASIQSFPLDYQFSGSRTSIIRQIGNAVPPKLAEAIGKNIKKSFKKGMNRVSKANSQEKHDIAKIRSKAFRYV